MHGAKPPLVVVGGATASGKSALALALAEAHAGTIVLADSRQLYRGFDLGTAKPTAAEQARVPHALVDAREPDDPLTVAAYREIAIEAIGRAHDEGRVPFLVGGTGLYIRAVVGELAIPPVPPDPERRAKFIARGDLHAQLAAVDPEAAARLHPNDEVRLARALEVHEVTGTPISVWQSRRTEAPFRVLNLAVDLPREALYARIDARVHAMLEAGWLSEVRALVDRYGADLPMLQTLGYRELLPVLAGDRPLEPAIADIQLETRRYAKRQLTWFRREGPEWLDGTQPARMLEWAHRRVLGFLGEGAP